MVAVKTQMLTTSTYVFFKDIDKKRLLFVFKSFHNVFVLKPN